MARLAVLVGTCLLLPSSLGADSAAIRETAPAHVAPTLAGPPIDVEPPAIDDTPEMIVPGQHVRIDTPSGAVHVWWPDGYDAATAVTIVYVHGYWVDVDDAWLQHGLPEQFGAAAVNALFLAHAPGRHRRPPAQAAARPGDRGRPLRRVPHAR
jgi:hypothetical protein